MLLDRELLVHTLDSLRRIGVGYVMGSVLGTALGIAIARVRVLRDLFTLPLSLVRSVPPVAIVPPVMIWFGTGELSKYVITMYTTLLLMTLSAEAGVSGTPPVRLRAARCLGAHGPVLFRRVVLPSAMPRILSGLRIAVGFAFMGVVAAELIAANTGVGFLIMHSRFFIRADRMFVGLLLLGLLATVADALVGRLLAAWLGRFRSDAERARS